MIVDAARDPRIFGMVLGCYLEYSCLYSGILPAPLGIAAPYLLRLEHADQRSRQFLQRGWGNSWGIFLKCDMRLEKLRHHLRAFLQVRDAKANKLLFRYYDPRVLRAYLPTCSTDELQMVFGPIERIWTEGEAMETTVEFAFDGARLLRQQIPLDTPVNPSLDRVEMRTVPVTQRYSPYMLTIRRAQLSFALVSSFI